MIQKLPNVSSLGANAIKKLTSEKLNELIEYQKPITLTGDTIMVWNMLKGYNAEIVLNKNKTLFFEQLSIGDYGTIKIIQDSVGSRTLTLPSNSKVSGGGAGVLSLTTTANAIDIATFYYDGVNLFWNISKNFS